MWRPAMLGFVPDQVVRPSLEGVGVVREGCNSALTPVYSAGLAKARRAGRIGGRPSLVVDRERMALLDEEGWTTREIGEEMGISAASVSRLLKAHHRPQNPAAGL